MRFVFCGLVAVFFVGACTQHQPRASAPAPERKCTFLWSTSDLALCQRRADGGDAEAAMRLADAYERGVSHLGSLRAGGGFELFTISRDPREAIRWYSRAADLGHALRAGDRVLF